MSGRPVIAVDIDEVLADFIPALALFHNDTWGSSFSAQHFDSYEFHDVWGGTREECNVKMTSFFESVHFREKIYPVPLAKECLQQLKEDTGVELHIVTSRQHAIADATREWIAKHYEGIFEELHFGNHYSSVGKKRSKPEMCKEIGALAIIDDSQTYAGQCAQEGIPCVLFGDYAWNKHDTGAGGAAWVEKVGPDVAKYVHRVGTNWTQAAQTLKRLVQESAQARARIAPLMAAVQLCASADKAANMVKIETLVRRAAFCGASLVSLPEACLAIGASDEDRRERIDGPTVQALSRLAAELNIWLNVGGVALEAPDSISSSGKLRNSSLMISDKGDVCAVYDKIHLFDNPYTQMLESAYTVSGDKDQAVAVAVTPQNTAATFNVGLTICYDVRFPALYDKLRREKACDVVCVPSAFMRKTGMAHWEVLLRARAIETQMYVVAAAQCGVHSEKRSSYGHSMIIDPWGEVVAALDGDKEGFCMAPLDLQRLQQVRRDLPVEQHHRL
jgi:predicted amidohydrolase